MFATMATSAWATVQLRHVPPPSVADRLADAVRRIHLGPARADDPIVDIDRLLAEATANLAVVDLGARAGGLEGAVLPASGGFRILVDPAVRMDVDAVDLALTDELGRQRLRFRVLHELAHTFFYDRSEIPLRVVRGSAAQELFCDRFAACFLLPTAVVAKEEPTPDAISALQAQYDVSMQLCVRRFAEVHGARLLALLAATGRHAPLLRTQWVTPDRGQRARWWAAEWIQDLLGAQGVVRVRVQGQHRDLHADALAFPSRGQVVIVGDMPDT